MNSKAKPINLHSKKHKYSISPVHVIHDTFKSPLPSGSSLKPPLLTLHTHRIITLAPKEVPPIFELASTFLKKHIVSTDDLAQFDLSGWKTLTKQQKQFACHSLPNALTTTSVTGLRHLRHLAL
jgi:hypothetical protein